ncbi:hypothetical protein MCOR25_007650 [Pyricularia grisea]|nr:hypothetical protein MCOR25_007650 [Pyricularia grisea]
MGSETWDMGLTHWSAKDMGGVPQFKIPSLASPGTLIRLLSLNVIPSAKRQWVTDSPIFSMSRHMTPCSTTRHPGQSQSHRR